jgi:hypothetical protein
VLCENHGPLGGVQLIENGRGVGAKLGDRPNIGGRAELAARYASADISAVGGRSLLGPSEKLAVLLTRQRVRDASPARPRYASAKYS